MDHLSQVPPANSQAGGVPEGKLTGGCPLGWQLERYERDEMLLMAGSVLPAKASDLLQNCDLPPPLKVFPATKTAAAGSPSPLYNLVPLLNTGHNGAEDDRGGGGDTHAPLLKALRLSQTRAREAEKKAAALGEKNKQMASLLVHESLRLYAHRQWLKLAEAENAWLRQGNGTRRKESRPRRAAVGTNAPGGCVVVAICLGIAGLGLVIGYRFLS